MCEYNQNKIVSDSTAEIIFAPDNLKRSPSRMKRKVIVSLILFICFAAVSACIVTNYIQIKAKPDFINSESVATVTGIAAQGKNNNTIAKSLTIPEIVKKAKPSVVGISSQFHESTGTGTGIIITTDGYIVTNAHVVQNSYKDTTFKANSVIVVLEDQSEHEARIIGTDTRTDLAVLKVDSAGKKLPAAELGNSDNLLEGELAVAIGNPLGFELYGSTTCGIISALNRTITIDERRMTLIQTDAAVNPGNSGGPLLNSSGQVIGINSSKIISGYTEGLGFAIPINGAKPVINDLIENGYVKGRPMIGISGEDINYVTSKYYDIPEGVFVRFIDPDSSAAKSGIKAGDIIVGVNNEKITTMDELNKIKDKFKAGESIELSVFRKDSPDTIKIKVVLDENVS